MYSMYIGKKYLELYNQNNNSLTAKEFFDKIYFPLFYDNEKYLQWIGNSPFSQLFIQKKHLQRENRLNQLKLFHNEVISKKPHMGLAIGFPAGDPTETTSGQVTNIEIKYTPEDIYSSWIGSGFGIGLSGGQVMLINHPLILEVLANGWKYYRQWLTDTPNLKPNQIDTWNGRWITHVFSKQYNPNYPLKDFNLEFKVNSKDNQSSISTQSWIKILFALARKFPNEQMIAYVFNLSQMNTTIGFITLNLPEVKKEIDLYDNLFGVLEGFEDVKQLDDFYDTEFSFLRACQMGSIGLRSIQPKDLKEYFPKRKMPKQAKDNEAEMNFKIYLSWIRAMLNSQELYNFAGELAEGLSKYSSASDRGKKNNSQLVEKVLESKSRKDFIQSLTEILNDDSTYGQLFDKVVKEILKMPNDNYPLFVTLIRFKYAMIQ